MIILLGMLSEPKALPLANFLRLRLKASMVELSFFFLPKMWPLVWCHWCLRIVHVQLGEWYVGSSHIGACLWNDRCWF